MYIIYIHYILNRVVSTMQPGRTQDDVGWPASPKDDMGRPARTSDDRGRPDELGQPGTSSTNVTSTPTCR